MQQYSSIISYLFFIIFSLTGCQSTYYSAMEKVGIHKRDIMVKRVKSARDAQKDAKQEFKSALEEFQSLFGKQNSSLQKKYDQLNNAYKDSLSAAEKVSDRIKSIENVSTALFKEWEDELSLYNNAKLKQDSRKKLVQTRLKYKKLMQSMHHAEQKMTPVLSIFQDQVLYLKHNLNANAIDGLKSELKQIQTNVTTLIKNMELSINESDQFIKELMIH